MPGYQGRPENFDIFKAGWGCANPIGTLFGIIFILMGLMCCVSGCSEAIDDGLSTVRIYGAPFHATIIQADPATDYCEYRSDDQPSVAYEVHPANEQVLAQCQQSVGRRVTIQRTVFGIYIVSIQP